MFRVQKTDGEQDISGITYDEWDKTGDSMGIKSKRRQDENGEMLLATWYIERYGYSYSYFVTAPDLGDGDDLILLSYAMYTGQAGAPAGYTEEDDSESDWEPEGD